MSDNFEEFQAELRAITARLPEAMRDLHVSVASAGYETAVRLTPVDTGALRSENLVAEGESDRIVYESPSRTGPDRVVTKSFGDPPIEPPSAGDAKAAMATVVPFSLISILNQRYYAGFVHNGTSQQAPQPWMRLAGDHVERLIPAAAQSIDLERRG